MSLSNFIVEVTLIGCSIYNYFGSITFGAVNLSF